MKTYEEMQFGIKTDPATRAQIVWLLREDLAYQYLVADRCLETDKEIIGLPRMSNINQLVTSLENISRIEALIARYQ